VEGENPALFEAQYIPNGVRRPQIFFAFQRGPCPKTWRNQFPPGGAANTQNHFKPP